MAAAGLVVLAVAEAAVRLVAVVEVAVAPAQKLPERRALCRLKIARQRSSERERCLSALAGLKWGVACDE